MILPFHDPFICGQLPQAHWPSGLQALGRNSNLRTKAHLPTVGKTGRGIDIHRRRVNSGDKARCVLGIFGEDAIGMSCRVCGDMLDRLLQPIDYLNPKDERKATRVKVVSRQGNSRRKAGVMKGKALSSATKRTHRRTALEQRRKKIARDVAVDKDRVVALQPRGAGSCIANDFDRPRWSELSTPNKWHIPIPPVMTGIAVWGKTRAVRPTRGMTMSLYRSICNISNIIPVVSAMSWMASAGIAEPCSRAGCRRQAL